MEDLRVNCQQRVDAIDAIRIVFLDVYDFADRDGDSPEIEELRERLDLVLPPLTMETCLAQYIVGEES